MCLHAVAKSDVLSKIFTPCKVHSAVVSSVGLRLADPSPLLEAMLISAVQHVELLHQSVLTLMFTVFCIVFQFCIVFEIFLILGYIM